MGLRLLVAACRVVLRSLGLCACVVGFLGLAVENSVCSDGRNGRRVTSELRAWSFGSFGDS